MPKFAKFYAVFAGVAVVLGMTAAAANAAAKPNPRTKIVHEHRGPNDFVDCDLLTGFNYSKSSPGYIQGTARYKSCTGDPYPSECSNTADLWVDLPKEGWVLDHQGPTEHGCPPGGTPSVKTAECHSTPNTESYMTKGIYVIQWDGETITKDASSSIYNLKRVC